MDGRTFDVRGLVLSLVLLIALSRMVEPPLLWGIAGLLLAAGVVATLQVLSGAHPTAGSAGVPVESLIVPAVAAVASLGALQLIPFGIWLVPALLAAGFLIHRTLRVEAGVLTGDLPAGPESRRAVMGWLLVVAFAAFVGVAASVPGGLPDVPGGLLPSEGIRLRNLVVLVGSDGLVAGLLGYRAAAIRGDNLREVFWSAVSCAAAVALAALGLRAMAIPRLMGPALLVIVFYLWDSVHGAVRADERDARRIWEALLLGVAGVVIIAWSLNTGA